MRCGGASIRAPNCLLCDDVDDSCGVPQGRSRLTPRATRRSGDLKASPLIPLEAGGSRYHRSNSGTIGWLLGGAVGHRSAHENACCATTTPGYPRVDQACSQSCEAVRRPEGNPSAPSRSCIYSMQCFNHMNHSASNRRYKELQGATRRYGSDRKLTLMEEIGALGG